MSARTEIHQHYSTPHHPCWEAQLARKGSPLHPTHQQSRTGAYRAPTLAAYSLAVAHVLRAMRANLSEPLSLDEMAEIACLSPFHFHRVFRATTGIPPGEFLAALRLDAAKRLLLTTSLSVTDVCFELGYASLGTFTTRFKRRVGLSPLQFRQLAGELTPISSRPLADAQRSAPRLVAIHPAGVSGSITAPDSFSGLIFVGLFPRPIPQNRPAACTTLTTPDHFQLDPVPDGRYYLLSAALPQSRSALTYLLPGTSVLVAIGPQPVLVRDGRASAPVDLALRPLHAADPPILGVFPPLLATPAAARIRAAI